ncbi:MAG: acyltransferase family protein [Marinicellaceae bacterium]
MQSIKHNEKKYIPEIDGLRAIAVLFVLFFHLHIPYFDGGFIGVDVFFVISGYLITGLIARQISEQSFSFSAFYLRRIRRLFPALLVVISFCYIASFILFSPVDFERSSGASVFSIVSFSNFFFYFESGYFDSDSYIKPLLHTWSLAVEEQFYLIWPILLFLFRKNIFLPIIILTVFSLLLSIFTLDDLPSANFFLMPFRIFEFGIGAVLYWIPNVKKSKILSEFLTITGLSLIFYAGINFNQATIFPGLNALIPCIGAALIILSIKSRISTFILHSKVAIHIGKISYSVYLVHWPVVVYYKYINVTIKNSFTFVETVLLLITTYILSLLLNIFIENKFRYSLSTRKKNMLFWTVLLSFSLLIILVASSSWKNAGWTWRNNHNLQNIDLNISELRKQRKDRIAIMMANKTKSKARNIVIIGDSHASDLLISFGYESQINYIRLPIPYRCQPVLSERPIEKGHHLLFINSQKDNENCSKIVKRQLNSKTLLTADLIIITARWKEWALKQLPKFVHYIQNKTDSDIIVFGPTIEFKRPLPFLINKHNQIYGLEQFVYENENRDRRKLSKKLQKITQELNIDFVDKFEVLCGSIDSDCPIIFPDGGILTSDYGHWTLETAELFKQNFKLKYPEIAKILL